ncbi:phospholipid scramblase-related protein [Streptomyces griseosporeus]|uniref:phospholipid scramblase-related protein n=1 Tax=Streptomyces griseosporeus TaxID=1910 RepID=UPI0037B9C46E
MTTHSNTPAGWYPDPHGAPQTLRYWDGAQWTQHTSPDQQAAAPAQQAPAQQAVPVQQAHQPAQAPHIPHQAGPDQRVQRQVQQQAGVAGGAAGGGTLFSEPVLVVNQKAKLIELTNEYKVMDQNGNQLGAVVQVGQSWFRKIVRFLYSIDQFMKIRLEIRDAYGQPVLLLTRPGKIFKSRVIVERPDGTPVGEIVQQNVFGKINFAMNVNGQQVGAIKAENWRAWNFAIVDHAGNEVARITKTWEGLAKTMFTTADNYVLQIHYQLPEPLLSLVVATALTVDTALKQDARGLG